MNMLQFFAGPMGGGFSWSSYWATRYPSALSAVPYSATRIDLGWTNNGDQDYDYISIEGSTDGVNYTEYDTATTGDATANITGLTESTDYYFRIRYVKSTSASDYSLVVASYTLPAALTDGHTLLWIPYEDSSLYTLSGSNVLELTDKLASGRKFVGDAIKPILESNGIHFNALNMGMTATFNFSAVYTLYLVLQPTVYRNGSTIMRLSAGGGISFRDANNRFRYLNGSAGSFQNADNSALGDVSVFIAGCKKDKTTGFFQIDDGAVDEGYVGLTDLTSIRFFCHGVYGSYTEFRIKEIILRDEYELGTATKTNLYNYCVKKK